MKDGAKMVILLTSFFFELKHSFPRFCESIHGFFQGFRCASRICTREALDGSAQEIMSILACQCLSCKSCPLTANAAAYPLATSIARNDHLAASSLSHLTSSNCAGSPG